MASKAEDPPAAARNARIASALFLRPHLLLRGCAALIALVLFGIVLAALNCPLASVTADVGRDGLITLTGGDRVIALDRGAIVTFRDPGGGPRIALNAAMLTDMAEPRGTPADNDAYWAARAQVAAMFARGPVAIDAAGERLIARARPRRQADLTTGFWASLISGALAALAGLWVWSLRPHEWAPGMFALSAVGLFGGCATLALDSRSGLAFNGSADHATLIANNISGIVCAGALAALFARFPQPLLRLRWLGLLAVVNVALVSVSIFNLAPRNGPDFASGAVLIDSLLIIVLLVIQTWRSRHLPEQRAGLAPIAWGGGISITLFCLLSLVGQLDGGKPLVRPDMTASLLLLIYIGLGIGITRARLFSLGRWALSMLLSACAIILFLIVDAIILSTVTRQRDLALLIAGMIGIAFYLPAREWLLGRAERARAGQASDLLQLASDVALAPTPRAAAEAWHQAARKMFDPLELRDAPHESAEPAIRDKGRAFYLPAPTGERALLLRYPGGGARIFARADLATAGRFASLVVQLSEARDSYLRGVEAERGRIARDLHDDVSARLLTSLHRADRSAMHDDVRTAMADIRTIVTGLSGRVQSLDAVMAGLRHEAQERLEAAGIALHWPLAPLDDDAMPLAYPVYRQLASIVRECVTNIIRHAGATRTDVATEKDAGTLRIVLDDDGRGFVEGAARGDGLANATRRAEAVGGTFDIARVAGGTRASITIPIA